MQLASHGGTCLFSPITQEAEPRGLSSRLAWAIQIHWRPGLKTKTKGSGKREGIVKQPDSSEKSDFFLNYETSTPHDFNKLTCILVQQLYIPWTLF